ncbi:YobI family P-loop NTPase [Paraclostridium bifermentans]|uniref:YobI family P-loop NTPase n=1 Tax=Paraclostridium bifermentans TaxID=1490 RepID=UPI0034DE08A9
MINIRNIAQNSINSLIRYLRRIEKNLDKDEQSENDYGYEKLSPKTDIENNYFEEIEWAVENKEITNIALGGPYGAGKSSIIKSYMDKRREHKYLNISLAYFSNEEGKDKPSTNNIEGNILKQMFYRVKHSKVPYSRYKRIKNTKLTYRAIIFVVAALSICSGIGIFNPKLMNKISENIKLLNSTYANIKLGYIYGIVFIITTFILLIKFIHFVNINIKLTKISTKVSQSTVELSNHEDDKSIFNKNIDEILYFFEVNKYNIVVFEDIDRFDNIEIFVKLRELNELINNCEQIKKKVTFIYAIKEDMFEDGKNRTKFFDFIIPVIPVINSSNSIEIMSEKLEENNLDKHLDKKFINDITIYIDDMRILTNIYNEFRMYKSRLCNINLNMNNLFGIIVYKNIYPKDFAKLQFNKGMVAEIFKKSNYVDEILKNLYNEYKKVEEGIEFIKNTFIDDVDELKSIYLEYLNIDKSQEIYIDGVSYNYKNFKESILVEGESLEKEIQYYEHNYSSRKVKIKDILNSSKNKSDYYERLDLITIKKDKNIEKLKRKLTELKNKKQKIQLMKVKDLIADYGIENIINEDTRKEKLIVYLLRNGYIDEMYNLYVTYFYEGSLTNEDMKFVQSIKNQEPLPYNYQLQNVSKVMERLYSSEFERPEILNYDLINFIISDLERYKVHYETVIEQLSNEEDKSKEFIDTYISLNQNTNIFINSISKKWTSIWKFIYQESNYDIDKVDEYLIKLIESLDVEDLSNINKENLLSEYISKKKDFLIIVRTKTDNKKVKQLLKELQVKFNYIDIELVDKEMIDYIYNENLYYINQRMIKLLIEFYTQNIDLNKLETCNYTTIKESQCENLIKYIKENINLYIEEVFLNIENNLNESEESVIELLSDESLKYELKYKIIEKEHVLISDIRKVNENLWTILFEKAIILIDWFNIALYMESEELNDKVLVGFLNNPENRKKLSDENIDIENYKIQEKEVKEIYDYIINNKEIENKTFKMIIKKVKELGDVFVNEKYFGEYITRNIEALEKDRLIILIELNLLELSKINYEYIKVNLDRMHIKMIEQNIERFFENYKDYTLDSKDIGELLKLDSFSYEQKDYIIGNINMEDILDDGVYDALGEEIGLYLLKNNKKVSWSILNYMLNEDLTYFQKVWILSNQIEHLDIDYIIMALNKLGNGYEYLLKTGKRPMLDKNEANERLVKALEEKDYISSWNIKDNLIQVNRKKSLAG